VDAVLYPIAPYYIANAQGGTGIDKDMFDEIARRSGCLLSYATDSRLRFWEQMRRGRPW
jgi:polar amino acid transport system substrate-binding protein